MSRLIFAVIGIIILCHGNRSQDCVFTDSGGSGNILDLRALKGFPMTYIDYNEHRYQYTACTNGLKCKTENGTRTGMSIQSSEESPYPCNILSRWDNGTTQPLYDDTNEEWIFEYNNGDEC